jgi:hypothetical protein
VWEAASGYSASASVLLTRANKIPVLGGGLNTIISITGIRHELHLVPGARSRWACNALHHSYRKLSSTAARYVRALASIGSSVGHQCCIGGDFFK